MLAYTSSHIDLLVELLVWTTLAGACILVGAGLASLGRGLRMLGDELPYFVIAFGGGVLVGAVALVLVPDGIAHLANPVAAIAMLLLGGAAFMALDRSQAKRHQSAPQFIAMGADFLPESLALGGMFAADADGAILLALLIGLQNLPEGFNAWRELTMAGVRAIKVVILMVLLALLGPLCGLVGWFWLVDHDAVLGAIMLFAAGGILYLTFQDIAPQARFEQHWAPPLGAVFGFALALLGSLVL